MTLIALILTIAFLLGIACWHAFTQNHPPY